MPRRFYANFNLSFSAVITALADKSANLAHFTEQLNSLNEQVDLIVLPETFATGFAINLDCSEPEQGEVLSWLKATAKQNAVVAGSVLVAKATKRLIAFIGFGQMAK